jgi:hypothetical protein
MIDETSPSTDTYSDRVVSKNPFARGKPAASNPFAKPAAGKANQATKSKSFFERVDDIQANGKSAGSKSKSVSCLEAKD